jgi:hypothetical protein
MTDLLDRPRIDPRFARRWIEARREEGRRRLRLVSIVAAILVCLAIGVGLLYSPLFDVRHVRVTVKGPVAASSVVQLAGLGHHPLMISLQTSAVESRLDANPALGGARVSKHWPSTVDVSVSVRTPVAIVQLPAPGSTGWAEIDATGRVLADVSSRPIGLPVLQGVTALPAPGKWIAASIGPGVAPGTPPAGEVDMQAPADSPDVPKGPAAELAVLADLSPILRSDVAWIGPGSPLPSGTSGLGPKGMAMAMTPPRFASGTLTVYFGDGSLLAAKISSLLTLLNQADLSGASVVDLSVPSRPATLTAPQ